MDAFEMTKLLLEEVEILIGEVATFVRCCSQVNIDCGGANVIEMSERLSLGLLENKVSKIQVNDIAVIPTTYKETIFGPLQKKELVSVFP